MKDFVKTLMGLGITVGLSDRENFVKNVSELIQKYQDDPEKAEKWSRAAVEYLQGVRDNINMQSALKSAVADGGMADGKSVQELTDAVKELTHELQQMKDKK
ncbi:MAG: hypothetical protein JWO06_1805 [Bacteroidota bacterium]|nr:hypothetical protein [Bacteroidota bacterium]